MNVRYVLRGGCVSMITSPVCLSKMSVALVKLSNLINLHPSFIRETSHPIIMMTAAPLLSSSLSTVTSQVSDVIILKSLPTS